MYSWSAKEHDKLIKQPNISSDSLMYQINWTTNREKGRLIHGGYQTSMKTLSSLILHPNLDEKSLLILANSNDSYIRDLVAQNPKCPREARITIALLNSNVRI